MAQAAVKGASPPAPPRGGTRTKAGKFNDFGDFSGSLMISEIPLPLWDFKFNDFEDSCAPPLGYAYDFCPVNSFSFPI